MTSRLPLLVAVALGAVGCSSTGAGDDEQRPAASAQQSPGSLPERVSDLFEPEVAAEPADRDATSVGAVAEDERVPVYRFVARSAVGECPPVPAFIERAATITRADIDSETEVHRVLVLGDSIVASRGNGTRGGQFDVMRCLASQTPVLGPIEMDLRAVPGQTIATPPPYSDSRGAVLTTFVEDLFRDGADTPDTVLITPSINELVVSPGPTREERVDIALDAIETTVAHLRSFGVDNVVVLPTPPVAARWSVSQADDGRTAADIAALNDTARERGLMVESLDYGLDLTGDGLGQRVFYDDVPTEPGADTFDGAHLDVDGQLMVGSAVFTTLTRQPESSD